MLPPGALVFGGIWSEPSSRRTAASSSPRIPAARASIFIRALSERNRPGFSDTGHEPVVMRHYRRRRRVA